MKKKLMAFPYNSLFKIASVMLLMLCFVSCSRKMSFGTSPIVPAAEGSVKIKKDKNKNYKIQLKVIRLTQPKRLPNPKDYYVVWMQTSNQGTKNIGNLRTSSGLLSKTLKSSLTTSTPFNPTGFFITAEDNSNPEIPAGQVVLKTN